MHTMSYKYGLAFTSGGTYEVTVGNTITGHDSGATAEITNIVIESGSWAGGDAAGIFLFSSQTGTFQSENLDVGGNSNVATIAADTQYCYVVCDGFMIRFCMSTSTVPNWIYVYDEDLSNSRGYFYSGYFSDASGGYFSVRAVTDFGFSVSGNASRVKVTLTGKPRTSGGSDMTNCTSYTETWYIYPDRVALYISLVLSGNFVAVNTPGAHRVIGYNLASAYITNGSGVYENSGSESAASNATTYNSADYLGGLSDELNVILINTYKTDSASFLQRMEDATGDGFFYFNWNNVTLAAGTHAMAGIFILDSAERDGSAKLYSSANRLTMGDQYKDYTI